MRVALVTCRNLPHPDDDEPVLLAALRAAGIDARMLAWDDPAADPAAFDLCIVRSTWNYYRHPQAFLAWIAETGRKTRLLNSAAAIRWNFHKRYLLELAECGFRTIPTRCLPRGTHADLAAEQRVAGWQDVVIKPAVSAGSYRTHRVRPGESAAAGDTFATLLAEHDVLIQPYQASIERGGERSIVWIDGEITHAVCKSPRFAGGGESVSGPLPVAGDERDYASALIAHVRAAVEADLLYARIDLIRADDGGLCLSELEIIEPSLFVADHPPALHRLTAAIAARLR